MTPRKHRYADMMRRWLDDESLEVEWLTSLGKWESEPDPDWDEGTELRFKPKMITVGDLEFPEPMRVAPRYGDYYWQVGLGYDDISSRTSWANREWQKDALEKGLCHTTQAAAEQHARALIALTESKS